jgi:hypothetical protein
MTLHPQLRAPARIALTLALCAASVGALAGRPLQTEDAGVLEPRACELEGAVARETEAGTTARERSLQVGCGIGAGTQLAAAVLRGDEAGEPVRGLAANGKTRLWEAQGWSLALAYGLAWTNAFGDGQRLARSALNLAATHELPLDLVLHLNVGHDRDRIIRLRSHTWGIALEHAGIGPFAPMAELHGDQHTASWNTGLRWTVVAGRLFVDASYGQRMASGRPRLATLGFKLAY